MKEIHEDDTDKSEDHSKHSLKKIPTTRPKKSTKIKRPMKAKTERRSLKMKIKPNKKKKGMIDFEKQWQNDLLEIKEMISKDESFISEDLFKVKKKKRNKSRRIIHNQHNVFGNKKKLIKKFQNKSMNLLNQYERQS